MQWLAQPEVRAFLIGAILMLIGAAILIVVAFPKDRPRPPVEPQPRQVWTPLLYDTPAPPNYTRGDRVHAWWVEQADAVTEVIDVAEAHTVILEKFLGDQDEPDTEPDPLDDTIELPAITDIESPLYYRLRPPPPLHLESFTTGWKRSDMLARIKEVHDADHR